MRILMIGAGGVGDAAAKIAVERDFFDVFVVADYDIERARRTVDVVKERRPGENRFHAVAIDASDADNVAHRNRGCSAGWRIGVEDFQDGSSYAAHPKDLDVAQRYLRRT